MDKAKRIAFIRPKAWPLANQIVAGVLMEQFPDHEVDVVEISTLVRRRPDLVLVNSIATILLYGKDIAQGRKNSGWHSGERLLFFARSGSSCKEGLQREGTYLRSRCNPYSTRVHPESRILYTPTTPTWKTVIIR